MLRKDVKIGFIVGGILIAVLIVYVLVVPGDKGNPNVELSAGGGAPSSVVPVQDQPTNPPAANQPMQVASSDNAKPVDPFTPAGTDTQKPVDPNDKWLLALNSGHVPLMTATPGPDAPSKPADAGKPQSLEAPVQQQPAAQQQTPIQNDPTILAKPPHSDSTVVLEPTTKPAGRTHVIRRGETLAKISEVAYGSQKHWTDIVKANPGLDPGKLKVGTTIVLPSIDPAKSAQAPVTVEAPAPGVDAKTQYVIQPGDSLHKIAIKLYGREQMWEKIYELNKDSIGADPAKLKVKSVIKLPEPPTTRL